MSKPDPEYTVASVFGPKQKPPEVPVSKPKSQNLLTPSMLSKIREDYSKVEKLPTDSKVMEFLKRLSSAQLNQLASAGIKWISPLAINQLHGGKYV
jgi:hypothetical protein